MPSKQKLLFIDRDGTIIIEPADEQIDSLEKLEFVPGAITALRSIMATDYVPLLVSNQDGLGTSSFPEETFWPAHRKMLQTLAGEGVTFAHEYIDRSFPEQNLPTRKPGTAMLTEYLNGDYDLAHSYVIGDRATDVQLAVNLGCQAILLQKPEAAEQMLTPEQKAALALASNQWMDVAELLRSTERRAEVKRHTAETNIHVVVDLDGKGETYINTGLHFFDHMLSQFPHHAGISLYCTCKGDLEVDEHHTMEDVAIAVGDAIAQAVGDKRGINRYGFALPMDESDVYLTFDFGGRIDFQWDVPFTREYVGDTPTEMFAHVFQSLCHAMRCNLHVKARGENNHHLIEGVFKAFARALRQAIHRDVFSYELPSSKGVL